MPTLFSDLEPRWGTDSALENFEIALRGAGDSCLSLKVLFTELDPNGLTGLQIEVQGVPLPARSPSAQWEAYDFVRLLVAAAYLRSDAPSPASEEPVSILQTVSISRDRERIRKAVLAYAAGGAEGLFEAYEALGSEIMNCGVLDYDAGIGTREWLVQRGWITEQEDDGFLKTIQHYRYQDRSASPVEPLSPRQAQLFVRKVLTNLLRYLCNGPLER